MTSLIAQKHELLDRPTITSLEDQRCQEEFQTNMLKTTNRDPFLDLEPLQVSKKLQYVALLAAQRCHVLGGNKALESLQLFNTVSYYALKYNNRSNGCHMYALYKPPILDEPGPWYPKDTDIYHNETIYTYMGCAVSFVDNTGCHVCYFQPDQGAVHGR